MRLPERIPIVLELFKDNGKKKDFLEYLFKDINPPGKQLDLFEELFIPEIDRYLALWNENQDKIKDFWIENPDLRLTQVLVNLGIIPNIPGSWYYLEEVNHLLQQDLVQPRDILFWGQNYDKDGNLLPSTRFILIRDMRTDHIEAILSDESQGKYSINEFYKETFNKELKIRQNVKV